MIGTDAIEGLQWKKEVPKWVGGRPTSGTGNYLYLPVLASDHYGLCAVMGDSTLVSPTAVDRGKGRKKLGSNRNGATSNVSKRTKSK
jgi:hypothetical protein